MNKPYTFVFLKNKNYGQGGWWLKIKNYDELLNYHQQTNKKYDDVLHNFLVAKEAGNGMVHMDYLTYAICLSAKEERKNIIKTINNFASEVFRNQLDSLREYGVLYINSKGGYCFPYNDDLVELQFVKRETLDFPDYKEDEIKITRFPLGKHFYVKIGDLEIIENGKCKWNTYERAYEVALKYITSKKKVVGK